jgi:biopolymer transport protein ExbD
MSLFVRRARKKPHIEIIPMIDVMLLLLVFYILSTLTLNQERGIRVELPQAKTGENANKQNLEVVITIDKQGNFFLNKQPIAANQLGDAITKLGESRTGGMAALQAEPVVINADLSAPYRLVIQTMDTLRKLDIVHFTMATEPEHS